MTMATIWKRIANGAYQFLREAAIIPKRLRIICHDNGPGFANAVRGAYQARQHGERPASLGLATLSPRRIRKLGWDDTGAPHVVLLSGQTLENHKRFLNLTDKEWRHIERLLKKGSNWMRKKPGNRRLLWSKGKKPWMAVVKQAPKGRRELFLVSVRRAKISEVQKWEKEKK